MQMIKATPNLRLTHQQLQFPSLATCIPYDKQNVCTKRAGQSEPESQKNNKISLIFNVHKSNSRE